MGHFAVPEASTSQPRNKFGSELQCVKEELTVEMEASRAACYCRKVRRLEMSGRYFRDSTW